MAIRNDLNRLNQVHEKVRKRDQLTQIVWETLYWLLDSEHSAINIWPWSEGLFDNISKSSKIDNDITDIKTDISGNRYTYGWGGWNAWKIITYSVGDARQTEITLQQVQRQKVTAQNKIERLERQNAERSTTSTQRTSNNNEITEYSTDISEYDRVIPLLELLHNFQQIELYYKTQLGQRETEFNDLRNLSQSFNVTTNSLTTVSTNLWGNVWAIDIEAAFRGTGTDTINYSLAGPNGEEISDAWNIQTQINGQTITIKGLSINNTANTLEWNNIQIEPLDNLTWPLSITLNVKGRITDPNTWVHLDHYKAIRFSIDKSWLDATARENQVNIYNTTGAGNKITDRLATNHTAEQYKRERDALIRAVKKDDGPKYDKYLDTPEKQEAFYQRIRKLHFPGTGRNFFEQVQNDLNLNTIGNFASWFANDKRKRNKDINITKSDIAYKTYLHNNMEEKIWEYFDDSLDSILWNNAYNGHDINMLLKAEITAFANEQDKSREENNTHIQVESDLAGIDSMETLWKDEEYIRFFKGAQYKAEKQELQLNMNRGPEDINNPEPFKYDMDLAVKGRNNIQVQVAIEGQKPILFKSWEPHTIINHIMKTRAIPHGSARVHMAYNVMKGFVQMAKEKYIDLSYFDSGSTLYHTIDIDEKTGNLVKKTINRANINYTQNTETLFDYQTFINSPSFDNATSNGALRQGIETTLSHFTRAMNGVHRQYHDANRRRWRWLRKSKNHFHFPRLRSIWGMQFTTNVETSFWNIEISCKRNRFTLSWWPFEKAISGKDLWKLMNKKINGERVFDGVEGNALESIYSSMLEKLREHKRVKKFNFWVRDPRTGKLYILDKNWDFGMMKNEEIVAHWNPIRNSNSRTRVGPIDDARLSWGMDLIDEEEKHQLLRNPELMYMLINAMRKKA